MDVKSKTSYSKLVWWVMLGALAFRLGFTAYTFSEDPDQIISRDSASYEVSAQSILDGKGFKNAAGEPEVRRTPGYPLVIATIYRIFGESRLALVIAQCVISVFTIYLIFLVASKLFSPKAGFGAAIIMGIDPMNILYSQKLLTESTAAFVNTLICLLGVYLVLNKKYRYALFLGLALAAGTMVRPINYYLVIAVAMGVSVYGVKSKLKPKKSISLVLLVLLPSVIIVGGWQLRNYKLAGTKQFSKIKAINMLLYRAAGIYALENDIPFTEAQDVLKKRVKEKTNNRENMSKNMLSYGTDYIISRPGAYLKLMGIGAWKLMFEPGTGSFARFINVKVPQNNKLVSSPVRFVSKWVVNSPLSMVIFIWTVGFLGLFYIFFIWGMGYGWSNFKENIFIHLFILGIVIYFIIISAGAESYSRFRVPFMPLMTVYAGYGLEKIVGKINYYNYRK